MVLPSSSARHEAYDSVRSLTFEYWLDGMPHRGLLRGHAETGSPTVLLSEDDDLTNDCSWASKGYTLAPFLDASLQEQLVDGIRARIIDAFDTFFPGRRDGTNFTLETYHQFVDSQEHRAFTMFLYRQNPMEAFPISPSHVWDRVSELVGTRVSSRPTHPEYREGFHIRIVRPRRPDNNPPHRDVYLDRLRNAVNIYVPLVGSTTKSSLPLMPGSHLMPESHLVRTSDGSQVNGIEYTVPCIVDVVGRKFEMTRPNPQPGEFLLFSPYLIHGGAVNRNADTTRISLEMRFWRCAP